MMNHPSKEGGLFAIFIAIITHKYFIQNDLQI